MNEAQGMEAMEKLNVMAVDCDCRDIAGEVLTDSRFSFWSGSSKPELHHYGMYGLIIHTEEVARLCLLNNAQFPQAKQSDPKKLFLSALYHDFGKTWDYSPLTDGYRDWVGTNHKRRVHHISRSAILWSEAARKHKFYDPNDDVLHAILSHHGLREWGSPVAPATRIAWLLHLCDGISARLDDCDRHDPFKEKK